MRIERIFFSDMNSIMSLTITSRYQKYSNNKYSNTKNFHSYHSTLSNTQVLFLEEACAHRSVSKEIGFRDDDLPKSGCHS